MGDMESVRAVADIFQNLAAGIGIIVAGAWAFRRYVLRFEDDPIVELAVGIEFRGTHKGYHLVEITATLKNLGRVPHEITDLDFDLRHLAEGAELRSAGPKLNDQVYFHPLIDRLSWLSEDQKNGKRAVIYPGTTMRYNHVANIPGNTAFLLLHGYLWLKERNGKPLLFGSDRMLKVPAIVASSLA